MTGHPEDGSSWPSERSGSTVNGLGTSVPTWTAQVGMRRGPGRVIVRPLMLRAASAANNGCGQSKSNGRQLRPAQGAAATELEVERPAARTDSPQVEFAVTECGAVSAGENEERSAARDRNNPAWNRDAPRHGAPDVLIWGGTAA